jgi:hypothetical protein
MKRTCLFLLVVTMYCNSLCHGKGTSTQLSSLYNDVGSSLTSIRKKFPDAQIQIYCALDKIDQLYSLAKKTHEKKKSLKSIVLSNEEKESSSDKTIESLKKEVELKSSELNRTKTELASANKKLSKVAKDFDNERKLTTQLKTENQSFIKKAVEDKEVKDTKKSKEIDEIESLKKQLGVSDDTISEMAAANTKNQKASATSHARRA